MKWIYVMLLLVLPAVAQTDDVGIDALFTELRDTTIDNTTFLYKLSTAAALDTFVSNQIKLDQHDASISINGRFDGKTAQDSAVIELGVYKGEGYPDGTGIKWYHIHKFDDVAADSVFDVSLIDSTWNTKFPKSKVWVRYRELGATAQQNAFWLWLHAYKPN